MTKDPAWGIERRKVFIIGAVAFPLLMLITALLGGSEGDSRKSDSDQSQPTDGESTDPTPETRHEMLSIGTGLPSDVHFDVTTTADIPGVKRSVMVTLSRSISLEQLEAFANQIHAAQPETYQRTFIEYYLEDAPPGSGLWATSHFDPTLEVRILGLPTDAASRVRGQRRQGDLGCWLDQGMNGVIQYALRKKGVGYVLEHRYEGGSVWAERVTRRSLPGGVRYDPVERSSTGDHYRVNSSGGLELWDSEGFIRELRSCD